MIVVIVINISQTVFSLYRKDKQATRARISNIVCLRSGNLIRVYWQTFLTLTCLWSKKKYCCLFDRLFKVKKNGVFLFGISFFVLGIFTFLYYASEVCGDVINRNTETRICPEILEQRSSNLAPEMYIKRETEWLLLCCCYHGNTLGSSLFP